VRNYERLWKERSPRMILNCRLSPKDSLRQNESVGKTGSLAVAKSTLPVRGKLMRRPDLFAMPDFRRNLTTARVSTRRWNKGLSETGSCDGRSKTNNSYRCRNSGVRRRRRYRRVRRMAVVHNFFSTRSKNWIIDSQFSLDRA
jgi:hypothetical protein